MGTSFSMILKPNFSNVFLAVFTFFDTSEKKNVHNHVKTQRKVVPLLGDFLAVLPPSYLWCCLQNAITFFFYLVPVEFWKVCGTKVFTLSVFQKKFEFVCFPLFLSPFFQKIDPILPNWSRILFGIETNNKTFAKK